MFGVVNIIVFVIVGRQKICIYGLGGSICIICLVTMVLVVVVMVGGC